MALAHLHAGIVSRGEGHSAIAKAAYNSRSTLECQRYGVTQDYSRHSSQCLFEGIYAPAKAPDWTRDRAQLWNHVEAFEKHRNAQLADELEIALPHELTLEQNRWLLQDWIKENVTRKGLIADVAIHEPSRHGDVRNIHAHVLVVTRKLDGSEFTKRKDQFATFTEKKAAKAAELTAMRESWEKLANKHLERHGHEARIDMGRLIDGEATIHLGKDAATMERQGRASERGDHNRQVRQGRAANENDQERADWIELKKAEAEAATLAELVKEQGRREHAAAEAAAELEAETLPQHREARPVFEADGFATTLDAMRTREARERGDGSARQARRAMDELARTDPHGTARHFGHHAGDRLRTMAEGLEDYHRLMRGGVSAEQAAAAAERAAAWQAATSNDHEAASARQAAEPPAKAPEAVRTQERPRAPETPAQAPENEADDQAAYIARQKAAHEEAIRLRAEAEASLKRTAAARRGAEVQEHEAGGMKAPAPTLEVTQRPSYEVEASTPAPQQIELRFERSRLVRFITTGRNLLAALAGRLEQAFAAMFKRSEPAQQPKPPAPPPLPGIGILGLTPWWTPEAAPPHAPEASQERDRERDQVSGPMPQAEPPRPAQTPEKPRGELFARFTRSRAADPTPEPAIDRREDLAGDVPHVWTRPTPATPPANPQRDDKPQAQRPEPPRPVERLIRRSIAEEMIAAGRARLEAERARETPAERARRERQEAEAARSRDDDSHERTRYRHGLLWELFHPFHNHRRRDHRPP